MKKQEKRRWDHEEQQAFQAIERFFYAINSTLSLHLLHYLHFTSNANLPTYLVEKGALLGTPFIFLGTPLTIKTKTHD